MHITILTSSKNHPIYPILERWRDDRSKEHKIELKFSCNEVTYGDFLFLISFGEIVSKDILMRFKNCLVVHASDLPKGRGWSPHIWTILNGESEIIVSLIEAEEKVDTGKIWKQSKIELGGHELFQEINDLLFKETLYLMDSAIKGDILLKEQDSQPGSYYPKRAPKDSEISVTSTIESVFNLLRVSDPVRYPAFFRYKGHKYKIYIEKDKS